MHSKANDRRNIGRGRIKSVVHCRHMGDFSTCFYHEHNYEGSFNGTPKYDPSPEEDPSIISSPGDTLSKY